VLKPLLDPLAPFSKATWIDLPCAYCGVIVRAPQGLLHPACLNPECKRKQAQAEQVSRRQAAHRSLPDVVLKELRRAGMGPLELQANQQQITPQILALTGPHLKALLAQEEKPSLGFGLSGGQGTGKTGLIAWLTREWTLRAARRSLQAYGVISPGLWRPAWANWESTLARMAALAKEGWKLGEAMDTLKEAPLLVIEDLGSERARDDKGSAWGNQQLYEVLEARYSAGRAVLWTTNLSFQELDERYPRRVLSRLMGIAPLLLVPGNLPDRRMEASVAHLRAVRGAWVDAKLA
jgi:hypothetical protein